MNDILFSPIRLDELESLIQNSVQRALKETQSTRDKPEPDQFLNIDQVCEMLGLAKPTIYALVSKRQIPHSKKNGKLFFLKSQINAWILEGKRKTTDELRLEI